MFRDRACWINWRVRNTPDLEIVCVVAVEVFPALDTLNEDAHQIDLIKGGKGSMKPHL